MFSFGFLQPIETIGGCSRIRTYGPLIKSQLLYQLSYAPIIANSDDRAIASHVGHDNPSRLLTLGRIDECLALRQVPNVWGKAINI